MSALTEMYTDSQRADCYRVNTSLEQTVEVRGKERKIECRKFTKKGIIFEGRMVSEQNQLVTGNVAAIVPNGVDTAQYEYEPMFDFDTQSRGGGGLAKDECGFDPQAVQYAQHKKEAYTELVYIDHKNCSMSFISTAWQDMVFTNDSYADGFEDENMLTDALLLAARRRVARDVNRTDVVGIYGGPNKHAQAYDGVLAQAYWAFKGLAYFQSIEFTVDTSLLVDGTYLHAKYAGVGCAIDLELDTTQASDPSLNRYQTVAEMMVALAQFLNQNAIKENGKRYVDVVAGSDSIVVTSRYAEKIIDLVMFVDDKPMVDNWINCKGRPGVTYNIIRNAMPLDERPFLVNYQRYTIDNILRALPDDIYTATADIPMDKMMDGQQMYLVIDPKVIKAYRHALKTKTDQQTNYNLDDEYPGRIIEHVGLENTGLWFVTAGSTNEDLRNIAHLTDIAGGGKVYVGPANMVDDGTTALMYRTLHGVLVRDFRLFASNVLCSPFAANLKQPYEKTIPLLPCYNQRVRDAFDDAPDRLENCRIEARFELTEEYENEAKYELDGVIYTQEAGQSRPAGAKPVYEIQLTDTSIGIPAGEIPTYRYDVTFEDGTMATYTDKNPVIQFTSSMSGVTFNVVQTVELDQCSSLFVASTHYNADYPFQMVGACGDISAVFNGTIFRTPDYTLAAGFTANSNINVFVAGVADVIDMSTATDPVSAAALVQAYLDAGNYAGTAVENAGALEITGSTSVIFVDNVATEVFSNPKTVSIVDNTAWDVNDGLDTFSGSVYGTAGSPPATPQFSELPDMEAISDFATFYVNGEIQSELGCTLELPEIPVAGFTGPEYFINFELNN